MNIYHYDCRTGEYLGQGVARHDPLESKPLIPRLATTAPPPEEQLGHARCWVDGGWQQVEDHRGEVLYSTVSGERREWSELGTVPEIWTADAPGEHQVWDAKAGAWVDDPVTRAIARRAAILAELANLDLYLPRSVEDLIEAGAIPDDALSQHNQQRLLRKRELRVELAALAA